jgi:hypothetical protein
MDNSLIVILAALNLEYEAVRRRLTDLRVRRHPAGTRFEVGRLDGGGCRVALGPRRQGQPLRGGAGRTRRGGVLSRRGALRRCGRGPVAECSSRGRGGGLPRLRVPRRHERGRRPQGTAEGMGDPARRRPDRAAPGPDRRLGQHASQETQGPLWSDRGGRGGPGLGGLRAGPMGAAALQRRGGDRDGGRRRRAGVPPEQRATGGCGARRQRPRRRQQGENRCAELAAASRRPCRGIRRGAGARAGR